MKTRLALRYLTSNVVHNLAGCVHRLRRSRFLRWSSISPQFTHSLYMEHDHFYLWPMLHYIERALSPKSTATSPSRYIFRVLSYVPNV